jgi:hypothetical protein
LELGVNNPFPTTDAVAIFNILSMLGVNTSRHERKDKLSSFRDGQYPIIFEGYLTVRHFMRHAKLIALTLLFLPLVVLTSAESAPTEVLPDPGPLFIILLFGGACLVLIGVGIVLALAGLALSALLVAFGIVSTSALVALMHRRVSSGLRALHYQLFALIAAPCGVVVLGFGVWLFHLHLRHRYILLFGLLAGVGAGIATAFLFDRIARLFYRRFSARRVIV